MLFFDLGQLRVGKLHAVVGLDFGELESRCKESPGMFEKIDRFSW